MPKTRRAWRKTTLSMASRNLSAAAKFFRKLFKKQPSPNKIVTDKLRSYSAALKDIGSSIPHDTQQYHYNRAEVSHQPTRQKERQMKKFKSIGQAQRFLSCHAVINNCFRQQRHLLKAKHFHCFRERAFDSWAQATCVQYLQAA